MSPDKPMLRFTRKLGLWWIVCFVLVAAITKLDAGKDVRRPTIMPWPEWLHDLPLMALIAAVLALVLTGVGYLGTRK